MTEPHRYAESSYKQVGTKDFIIRERRPPAWQLVLLFIIGLFTIIQLVRSFENLQDHPALILSIFVIIGFLTWFTVFFAQRNRDLVMATEFQNALFANAAALNTRFCLITKKDGTIIYYDPGFQSMFPDFLRMERRAIDILLQNGGAGEPEIAKIFKALESNAYEKLILTLRSSDGTANKIVLSIDPLPRPNGFFIFRGREYIEQRSAGNMAVAGGTDLLKEVAATPALMLQLLNRMPVGTFVAAKDGTLLFINHTLEQWLGYEDGEALARRLTLQELLYQNAGKSAASIEPEDFDGDVQMQKKTGALLKTVVRQSVVKGSNGQTLGCMSVVELAATDSKKN